MNTTKWGTVCLGLGLALGLGAAYAQDASKPSSAQLFTPSTSAAFNFHFACANDPSLILNLQPAMISVNAISPSAQRRACEPRPASNACPLIGPSSRTLSNHDLASRPVARSAKY